MTKSKYSLPIPSNCDIDTRDAPFHKTSRQMIYAIDFALPEGTPILAARSGVVITQESRYSKSYTDTQHKNKCNYIEVRHADGEISQYVHLMWRSLRVKKGETIKMGQIIALSGATGYTTYPHLHFAVLNKDRESIKIEFCSNS